MDLPESHRDDCWPRHFSTWWLDHESGETRERW
nr:MAG TPA: hypothetical protein [Caudoviricetes sp.]